MCEKCDHDHGQTGAGTIAAGVVLGFLGLLLLPFVLAGGCLLGTGLDEARTQGRATEAARAAAKYLPAQLEKIRTDAAARVGPRQEDAR